MDNVGLSNNTRWEEVGKKLGDLVNNFKGISLVYGEVSAIDEDKKTMDAVINDDHTISGISLEVVRGGNSSVLFYPVVGSICVLGFVESQPEQCVIIRLTELQKAEIKIKENICTIDENNISLESKGGSMLFNGEDEKISFNGGDNGGLIKIKPLTDALNQQVIKGINDLISFVNRHTHMAPMGSTSPPLPIHTQIIQNLDKSKYENKDIEQ